MSILFKQMPNLEKNKEDFWKNKVNVKKRSKT